MISTIRGYGDLLWVDVVERLDGMAAQVNEFQAQCKKLPKVGAPCGAMGWALCSIAGGASAFMLAEIAKKCSLLTTPPARPPPLCRHCATGRPTRTAAR